MNKKTIWTIAIIMGLSFLALLLLQLNYIEEMAEMKKEQFDESVNRALYQASRNMDKKEMPQKERGKQRQLIQNLLIPHSK